SRASLQQAAERHRCDAGHGNHRHGTGGEQNPAAGCGTGRGLIRLIVCHFGSVAAIRSTNFGNTGRVSHPAAVSKVLRSGSGMSNTMWGGRFSEGPDEIMEDINVSIDVDRHLFAQDIAASKAHAAMLAANGIITASDAKNIGKGLDTI